MDRRARQSEQAKFMRIKVDLQLDKPLRRGGRVACVEGEKCWVSFRQYGDWLRAQGNTKLGMVRSKSTSTGERDRGSEDKIDGITNTTGNFSAGSVSVGGEDHSGGTGKGKNSNSNEGSTRMDDVRRGGSVQGAAGDSPIQVV
nr:hypothetical protein CFP56_18102 [Quercus suber]